jgi:serine/threonine protein kinase
MHKYTKNPAAQLESFKAELHVMRFNHPNIVKTLAATHIDQFDDGAWVVMEYIGRSSLQVNNIIMFIIRFYFHHGMLPAIGASINRYFLVS